MWEQNSGQCGLCGDAYHLDSPRPHEAGGMYAKGIISKFYAAGQVRNSHIFFRIIFLFKSTNWNAISPFRQLRLKLNWRQIIKDTSRSPYVQIIIHKLKPIKTVSTSIHWRLRMLKIINFSYLTRLENGEFSNIESNYRHSWLVHNAFCSGHTTQEICGAHAQMAQNPSVAENQVKLNSIHFSIICSEKKSRFSLSNICLSVDSVTIKTSRINRCNSLCWQSNFLERWHVSLYWIATGDDTDSSVFGLSRTLTVL